MSVLSASRARGSFLLPLRTLPPVDPQPCLRFPLLKVPKEKFLKIMGSAAKPLFFTSGTALNLCCSSYFSTEGRLYNIKFNPYYPESTLSSTFSHFSRCATLSPYNKSLALWCAIVFIAGAV